MKCLIYISLALILIFSISDKLHATSFEECCRIFPEGCEQYKRELRVKLYKKVLLFCRQYASNESTKRYLSEYEFKEFRSFLKLYSNRLINLFYCENTKNENDVIEVGEKCFKHLEKLSVEAIQIQKIHSKSMERAVPPFKFVQFLLNYDADSTKKSPETVKTFIEIYRKAPDVSVESLKKLVNCFNSHESIENILVALRSDSVMDRTFVNDKIKYAIAEVKKNIPKKQILGIVDILDSSKMIAGMRQEEAIKTFVASEYIMTPAMDQLLKNTEKTQGMGSALTPDRKQGVFSPQVKVFGLPDDPSLGAVPITELPKFNNDFSKLLQDNKEMGKMGAF